MKKRIVAVLLSAAMIFTMAPVSPVSAAPEDGDNSVPAVQVDAENPGNNIALKATADASYTNTYGISPASMNDGELATNDPYSSWNSWGTPSTGKTSGCMTVTSRRGLAILKLPRLSRIT